MSLQLLLRRVSIARLAQSRSTSSLVDIAKDVTENPESSFQVAGALIEEAGSSTTYEGPRLRLRNWPRDSLQGRNAFYSPNDFQRSRRVMDLTTERNKGRPSGLGPSAARAKLIDPFHIMKIDPRKECMNASLMGSYVTRMGMIMNRGATGLTRRNQRLLGKAIKRARNMGVIPTFSRPRFLRDSPNEQEARGEHGSFR